MFALSTAGAAGALPIALVGAVLVLLAWAVGLATRRGSRAALWVALVTCLAVIGWVTIGLTIAGTPTGAGGVNLTPFQEILRALDTGASTPWRNLVGNIVLFVPFGAVVAALVRRGFFLRVLTATMLGAGLSAGIEAAQFLLGRVADVDDIILNSAGALLGAVIAATVVGIRSGSSRARHYPGPGASSSVGRAADF
ncbi:VanZ family protein [Demequina sp.]|uniref:VanZ family protein n=1 Tax=Demequina sp. TaxID=2050685 RepID=UPI003457B81A